MFKNYNLWQYLIMLLWSSHPWRRNSKTNTSWLRVPSTNDYCWECVICTRVEIATKENCLMGISIQKSMTKIYPSQKDLICTKMEGRRSCPSNLSYIFVPSRRGIFLSQIFALKSPLNNFPQLQFPSEYILHTPNNILVMFHMFLYFFFQLLGYSIHG